MSDYDTEPTFARKYGVGGSEEIASADSLLNENAQLRARILEWEDAYDRLTGAFDLHMAILECNGALADLAGGYYDVVLGVMTNAADTWRAQLETAQSELVKAETARKAWTDIGAKAQADAAALRDALEYRHTCENCGGKGVYWTDVNGEAESEVCDCYIRADHALYHEEHGAGAQLRAELEAARRVATAAQLAANMLFTLSYRSDLDDNTRAAIKDVQLALDSALHDPPAVTAQRPEEPARSHET